MKYLIPILIAGFYTTLLFGQMPASDSLVGKYEGLEILLYALETNKSGVVNVLGDTWAKKTLTLNRDGSFSLEFPDRWPRASHVQTRYTKGRWSRKNDTLTLMSRYGYNDFLKVREDKTDSNHIRVKLSYRGKKYYPVVSVRINDQTIDTKGEPWTCFPLAAVSTIEINRYNAPRDHKWLYTTVDSTNNSFVMSLIDDIKGNNYVVENYRLRIVGSNLVQLDREFKLKDNCFRKIGSP